MQMTHFYSNLLPNIIIAVCLIAEETEYSLNIVSENLSDKENLVNIQHFVRK